MGISLAPDAAVEDPAKPKKEVVTPKPPAPGAVPLPTVAAPSAPVDRVKLATDIFNTSAQSTQGAYDAVSRENVHNSAALGQVASGGLRTREGNLQLARGRDLDTMRKELVNTATEGSIHDAETNFNQGLAGSQLSLQQHQTDIDEKYKAGQLSLAERNQALAELAQQQNLALEKERLAESTRQSNANLELEKRRLDIGSNQTQQQIDLQKGRDDIEAKYKAGTLSLAERDQALNELQNSQSYGLAVKGYELAAEVQRGNLTLAQAQQKIQEAYQNRTMTLAERNQALAELTQSQNQGNEQQRIQLAKDQLAQTGAQFGLSLAQQKDLATLADKTQNRQLDIASAQGKNSLLLELARIMGGTSGNIDPEFLKSVMAALGFGNVPTPTGTTTTGTTTTTTSGTGTTGGDGGTGGTDELGNHRNTNIILEKDPEWEKYTGGLTL